MAPGLLVLLAAQGRRVLVAEGYWTLKASEWIPTVPEHPGFDRDQIMLAAVIEGWIVPVRWAPLAVTFGSHTGTIWVAEDALQIGEPGDAVRIIASARLSQQIADYLGALLPTPRISDLTYQQAAIKCDPHGQTPDSMMAWTKRMVIHSHSVDGQVKGQQGLAATVGKDWVISNALQKAPPGTACNYGWHIRKTGKPIQTVGTHHNMDHSDYSQTLRLTCRTCEVDGVRMPLDVVLQSKELAGLASNEGPLFATRQPGVPFVPAEAALVDP